MNRVFNLCQIYQGFVYILFLKNLQLNKLIKNRIFPLNHMHYFSVSYQVNLIVFMVIIALRNIF